MTRELIERSRQRRAFTDVPTIVAALSLVVSLMIAGCVVSIGIARADTLAPAAGGSGKAALVAFVAFAVAGIGWLAGAMLRHESPLRS